MVAMMCLCAGEWLRSSVGLGKGGFGGRGVLFQELHCGGGGCSGWVSVSGTKLKPCFREYTCVIRSKVKCS